MQVVVAHPLLVRPIASPGLHPIPFNTALPNSAIRSDSYSPLLYSERGGGGGGGGEKGGGGGGGGGEGQGGQKRGGGGGEAGKCTKVVYTCILLKRITSK